VKDVEEAIAYVNANDHPLALYVFSQDAAYKQKGIFFSQILSLVY
jgi:aldehyde dehydrogenase (NAD+)